MVNSIFVLYLFSYKVDVVKVPIIDSNFKPLDVQNQQQIHNGNKMFAFDDVFGSKPEMKQPSQAPFLYPNMASTPAIMMPMLKQGNQLQNTMPGIYPSMANTPNMVMPEMRQPSQSQLPLQMAPSMANMARIPNAMVPVKQPSQTYFPLPVVSPLRLLPILDAMPVTNYHHQPQSHSMHSNLQSMQNTMTPVMKQPCQAQSSYSVINPYMMQEANRQSQSHFPLPVLSPLRILPILNTVPAVKQASQVQTPMPVIYPNKRIAQDMMMPPNKQISQPHFPTPVESSLRLLPILHLMPITSPSQTHSGPIKNFPTSYVNNGPSQPQFPWSVLSAPKHMPNTPDFLGSVMHKPAVSINTQPSQPPFPWTVLSSPRHMLNKPEFIGPVMHMPTSSINIQPPVPHLNNQHSQAPMPCSCQSSLRHMPTTPDFGPVMQSTSHVNNQHGQNKLPCSCLSSPSHMPSTPDFGPVIHPMLPTTQVHNQKSQPLFPWAVHPSPKSNPFVTNMAQPVVNHLNQQNTQLPVMNSNKPSLTDLLMPLIKQISQSNLDLPPSSTPTVVSMFKNQPQSTSNPEMILATSEFEEEDVTVPEMEQKIENGSTLPETSPIIDLPNTLEFDVPEEETPMPEAGGLPSVSTLPTVQIRPMSADLKTDFKDDDLTVDPVFIELLNSI